MTNYKLYYTVYDIFNLRDETYVFRFEQLSDSTAIETAKNFCNDNLNDEELNNLTRLDLYVVERDNYDEEVNQYRVDF